MLDFTEPTRGRATTRGHMQRRARCFTESASTAAGKGAQVRGEGSYTPVSQSLAAFSSIFFSILTHTHTSADALCALPGQREHEETAEALWCKAGTLGRGEALISPGRRWWQTIGNLGSVHKLLRGKCSEN